MAVKLARTLGADITIFTTDKDKIEPARAPGASEVVIEGEKDAYQETGGP